MPEGAENLRRRFRSMQAAAAAGIVYAICSSTALTVLSASPAVSAPQAEVREYYGRAQAGDQVVLAISLMIVSVIGFLWFMAWLLATVHGVLVGFVQRGCSGSLGAAEALNVR